MLHPVPASQSGAENLVQPLGRSRDLAPNSCRRDGQSETATVTRSSRENSHALTQSESRPPFLVTRFECESSWALATIAIYFILIPSYCKPVFLYLFEIQQYYIMSLSSTDNGYFTYYCFTSPVHSFAYLFFLSSIASALYYSMYTIQPRFNYAHIR